MDIGLQVWGQFVERPLGVVLVGATVSYLVDLLAAFLVPDFAKQIHPFLIIVPAIAEVWMVIYLLVFGVRALKPDERTRAAGVSATAHQSQAASN